MITLGRLETSEDFKVAEKILVYVNEKIQVYKSK